MTQRLPAHPIDSADARAGLPSLDSVDALDAQGLVDLAMRASAVHARAMARLTMLATPISASNDTEGADRYVEASQIATWLTVPLPYVYGLIRGGQLPAITFGKYKRVRVGDFRKWAAEHQVEGLDYLRMDRRIRGSIRAAISTQEPSSRRRRSASASVDPGRDGHATTTPAPTPKLS